MAPWGIVLRNQGVRDIGTFIDERKKAMESRGYGAVVSDAPECGHGTLLNTAQRVGLLARNAEGSATGNSNAVSPWFDPQGNFGAWP